MNRAVLPLLALSACQLWEPPVEAPDNVADELLVNVEAIRHAIEEASVLDDPRACSSEAEAKAAAGPSPRAWKTEPCWTKLGWEPDTGVRGGYWITVDGEGGYTVHGVGDSDGDGTYVVVEATQDTPARQLTPDDVK